MVVMIKFECHLIYYTIIILNIVYNILHQAIFKFYLFMHSLAIEMRAKSQTMLMWKTVRV